MLRRALIAAVLPFALLAGSVRAAPAQIGQYVELQPVGLPIVVHGQLVNYVFVYVRLNLAANADAAALRDKEPYFRDALVRAAHRTPFTVASDYNRIDQGRLVQVMMAEAAAIAGPGAVRSVVVTSEAPRRRIVTPKP